MEIPIERNFTYQIRETIKLLDMFTEFKIYHEKRNRANPYLQKKIPGKAFMLEKKSSRKTNAQPPHPPPYPPSDISSTSSPPIFLLSLVFFLFWTRSTWRQKIEFFDFSQWDR